MSFAFGTEDMVLAPIGEDAESFAAEHIDFAETMVTATKMKTATLAQAAQQDILELSNLLGNLTTGTATREEKERLHSLNVKLDGVKDSIKASKADQSNAELKFLKLKTQQKVNVIQTAVKVKEIRSVVNAVCQAESVDLAFIVDCTGSMESHIAAIKKNISEIVRQVTATNGNLRLRLAFVAYRGVNDGPLHHESLNFTSSIQEFENFVAHIEARGGDCPLANIALGVKKANQLSWSQSSRVVFLICDYPCHGSAFHNGLCNRYPGGAPGIDIVAELKSLRNNAGNGTMTFNFGKITDYTDTMIKRFKLDGIDFDVVDIRNQDKVTSSVSRGIRKSIFRTMTFTNGATSATKSVAFAPISGVAQLLKGAEQSAMTSGVSLKSYHILPLKLSVSEWKNRPAVGVKVFRNRGIKNIKDLQVPIRMGVLSYLLPDKSATDKTRTKTAYMRCAKEPFAEGETRLAYHGQLARIQTHLENDRSSMVMKSFKHVGRDLNGRDQYLKQMEVSTIGSFLAREYNDSIHRPGHCAQIRVLQVCVVEEEDEANEKLGNRRFCAEEPLPDGTFEKFSNNTGQWDEDILDESLLRFSDYTYQATNGYLMVTDLQGVHRDNAFHLTDPVVLCQDILRFGNTNLGEGFMSKCIDSTRAYMKENDWH